MPRGWRGESERHDLARQGIKTGRKQIVSLSENSNPLFFPVKTSTSLAGTSVKVSKGVIEKTSKPLIKLNSNNNPHPVVTGAVTGAVAGGVAGAVVSKHNPEVTGKIDTNPLPKGTRFRFRTLRSGKKQRIAFKNNKVLEVVTFDKNGKEISRKIMHNGKLVDNPDGFFKRIKTIAKETQTKFQEKQEERKLKQVLKQAEKEQELKEAEMKLAQDERIFEQKERIKIKEKELADRKRKLRAKKLKPFTDVIKKGVKLAKKELK